MNVEELIKWLLGLLGAVVVAWLSVLSWIGKRIVARVDHIEDRKANRESTDQRFDRIMDQIDAHIREDRDTHQMIADKIDLTNERLGETNVAIAGILGELKGRKS